MLTHFPKSYPLGYYKDRFAGGEGVLVACAPTLFNYEQDLSSFKCPIFFVNDAITLEKYTHQESETFFSTHHAAVFLDLMSKSKKTTVLYPVRMNRFVQQELPPKVPTKIQIPMSLVQREPSFAAIQPPIVYEDSLIEPPLGLNIYIPRVYLNLIIPCSQMDYEANVSIRFFPKWCIDKELIAERKTLMGHTGSITHLIHFAWFCGIKKLTMIGCNPKWVKHHRHDERLCITTNASVWDLKAILENQVKFLEYFQIKADYLGDYDYKPQVSKYIPL